MTTVDVGISDIADDPRGRRSLWRHSAKRGVD
jgi:hypothetical protein